MPTFPSEFQAVIYPYARLFCRRVFAHVQLLLLGAILAPGKRTVTSVLRIISLGQQPAWHKYHRVLSRARWSARAASRVLLAQLVAAFLPAGPLIFGLDETLERRWGPRIAARGIYRDAVRNSKAQLVKGSGLRWLSVFLLTPLPWAARIWALPAFGPCPCSRCWPPRPIGPRGRAAATKKSRIGPGKSSSNSLGGYQDAPLSAWVTAATRC
ncbi:MAG: transposase [Janthinobacterium lividum]